MSERKRETETKAEVRGTQTGRSRDADTRAQADTRTNVDMEDVTCVPGVSNYRSDELHPRETGTPNHVDDDTLSTSMRTNQS